MKKKPLRSFDELPPPSNDPDGVRWVREEGVEDCPCGMPAHLPVEKHTGSCELRAKAGIPWTPIESDRRKGPRVLRYGRRLALPPTVDVPQLPAPAPVALLPEPPARSGEQLALIPFPTTAIAPMKSAAQVAMPTRAISFDQAGAIDIRVKAPPGTRVNVDVDFS